MQPDNAIERQRDATRKEEYVITLPRPKEENLVENIFYTEQTKLLMI